MFGMLKHLQIKSESPKSTKPVPIKKADVECLACGSTCILTGFPSENQWKTEHADFTNIRKPMGKNKCEILRRPPTYATYAT